MQYGNCQLADIVPVVSNAVAYTAGDTIGGLITLGPMKSFKASGILKNVLLTDASAQGGAMTLLFFSDLPAVIAADNAALALSKADVQKVVAKVEVATGDWKTVGALKVAQVEVSQVIKSLLQTRTLYLVIQTAGTQTYDAVDALQLRIGILSD